MILKKHRLSPKICTYFFDRHGGVSEGDFAFLNVGLHTGDNQEHVHQNRSLVAQNIDIEEDRLVFLNQIHSNIVIEAAKAKKNLIDADSMITNQPLALAIQTADCMPILLAEPSQNIIAAIHAGWKGAFDDIIENSVQAIENKGGSRNHIHAIIGPCIHQASYEVDQKFKDRFLEQSNNYTNLFIPSSRDNHYLFDFPQLGVMKLERSGIQNIIPSKWDTCADERFFSHRRASLQNKSTGRIVSVIALHL